MFQSGVEITRCSQSRVSQSPPDAAPGGSGTSGTFVVRVSDLALPRRPVNRRVFSPVQRFPSFGTSTVTVSLTRPIP